jgi:RNA recognition motif-containing protein
MSKKPNGHRLYVGNLPYGLTDSDELVQFFGEYGIVASRPLIVLDKETGQSKGFGFVEVGSEEDAERAMSSMNGASLDGRAVKIDRARERQR